MKAEISERFDQLYEIISHGINEQNQAVWAEFTDLCQQHGGNREQLVDELMTPEKEAAKSEYRSWEILWNSYHQTLMDDSKRKDNKI